MERLTLWQRLKTKHKTEIAIDKIFKNENNG